MPLSPETAAKSDAPATKGDHNNTAADAKKNLAQEAADERARAQKAAAEKAAAEKAAAEKAAAEKAATEKAAAEKAATEKAATEKAAKDGTSPSASDSSAWSSMATSIKKAGAFAWEAASEYLPSFGLYHSASEQKAEIKKEESLDLDKLVSASCSGDTCKAPAAAPESPDKLISSLKAKHQTSVGGFGLTADIDPKDLKFQTDHASILNTNQLNDVRLAELQGLEQQKVRVLSDVQKLGNADVHRDASGKVDAYRTADGTKVFLNEMGTTEVKPDGSIIRKDKSGHVYFEMTKDGSYKGDTTTGQAEVDATTGAITLRDKQGNIIAVQHKDRLRPSTIHTSDSTVEINVEDMNMPIAQGVQSFIDRAKQEGKPVQFTYKNAIVNANPDGSVIGVLNDGTGFMAIDPKHIVVRRADGSYELHGPEGPAQKLTAVEMWKKLKEQGLSDLQIAKLRFEMHEYAKHKRLHLGDGHNEIHLDGKTITAVSGQTVVTNAEGQIAAVDQARQITATYNPETNSTTIRNAQGDTTKIAIDDQGKAKIDDRQLKAEHGRVEFENHDSINADRSISFANGTNYHTDGSTTFRDGSSFNADGSITSASGVKSPGVGSNGGRVETIAEAQKEAQAVSMAAYAQSVASSLRGLAASGHASASDLAALASAYSSICSAVAALDDSCDPATRVQLMMTQDSVGSALDVATGQVCRKEEVVKIIDDLKSDNPAVRSDLLATLRYSAAAA